MATNNAYPYPDQEYHDVGGGFLEKIDQITASAARKSTNGRAEKIPIRYTCTLRCRVPSSSSSSSTTTTETKDVEFEATRMICKAIGTKARYDSDFNQSLAYSIGLAYQDTFEEYLKEQLDASMILCYFCGIRRRTITLQVPIPADIWLQLDNTNENSDPLEITDTAGYNVCHEPACQTRARSDMMSFMQRLVDFQQHMSEEMNIDFSKKCLCCMKIDSEDQPLRRCSRCKKVYFCDKNCQKRAWKKHKLDCVPSLSSEEE